MAKVSENKITSIDQDWGNDSATGLPYSGEAVQEFIKEELQSKATTDEVGDLIKQNLKSQLFNGGSGAVVTGLDGNSNVLNVSSVDYEGKTTTSQINIGTPDENDRFVSILSVLSNQYINVGGSVEVAYGFIVTDYQGAQIDNSFASVNLSLSRQGSANAFYTQSLGTIGSASSGTSTNQSVDITSAVANNITGSATVVVTLTLTYQYTYTEDGETKTKTITKVNTSTLTVLALTLNTSVSIANTASGQVSIPYTVRGNGNKTVYLYKNGTLVDQHDSITAASSSNVFVQTIGSGITNYQLVAETTAGDTTIRSSSFYFDLIGGTSATLAALLVEDSTGTIQGTNYATPEFNASKFSDFKFKYFAFTQGATTTEAVITTDELNSDGVVIVSNESEQTLGRNIYTYSKKIKSSNKYKVTISSGDYTRYIVINPLTSNINIELPTDTLVLNLDADGRSNEEANPAVWKYGDVTTDFSGFNWSSNGWIDNALVLKNGAKAVINFPLFQAVNNYPVTRNGCAFEILFKCSNASLEEHDIISCYWNNNSDKKTGLNVTTSYVGVDTGEMTDYTDDDGNVTQSVETRVGSQYAQDEYYKYIFVIDPTAASTKGAGLCKGYLNGVLSYVAEVPTSFINLDTLPIVIDSTYADVYVKSIKYYNAPLTHDQCTDEFIIDQSSSVDIENLYNSNDVLAEDSNGNTYVSPAKLRALGHGVMIISPSKGQSSRITLQELNKSTDKEGYYGPFRVAYFAPKSDLNLGYSSVSTKGDSYNFLHKECAIRIQGTTSTKRPRKNYRLHFNKFDKNNKPSAGSFIVGGEENNSFKYAMSEGAVAVPIACLKTDYVDSSMTHNTGGAVVFNELTRVVPALRNPAQQREFVSSVQDIKTRVAIEGFPIDVFAASDTISDTVYEEYTNNLNDSDYVGLEYMGQYNYNNDKSKSGKVFGFDGAYTYDEDGNYDKEGAYQPICMEFLDNNAALDLFHVTFNSAGNIDEATTYSTDNFGGALEVRAPEDATDQVADFGLDSLKTGDLSEDGKSVVPSDNPKFAYIPDMVKRIFNFVGLCAKQVAQANGKSVVSLNTMTSEQLEAMDWTSTKFAEEATDYFNMNSVCGWYVWTDYCIAVDQRAKNMMIYTMDGKHWMFQYYDGDTAFGERNDCFLAYDYLTDRDTWDDGVKQYAFQGHDSWLWYLVRANFSSLLDSMCQEMRTSGKFSADYFNQIFNKQFVANWSERQYNYSQQYKYIQPLSESGYPSDISTNFINTAQGSREAHRTYTIQNRFSLLDSKYQAGNYAQDAFVYYAAANSTNNLTIVSSIPYYFGWNTSNTAIKQHTAATANNKYTVQLTVTGNSANNPANVLGASRIKELTFSPTSAWTVDSTKDLKLANLQRLVAKDMSTRAVGDLYISSCPVLTYLDLSNSNFTGLYGIDKCSKLTYLNVKDSKITSVKLPAGAPVETVELGTVTSLYMSNLSKLYYTDAQQSLSATDWSSLSELAIINCPNIDWESLADLLVASTASTKFLRITDINISGSITWLDKFDGIYGLDEDGTQMSSSAQLVGTLQLLDYTDDNIVAQYAEKYPNLIIKQPEYTIIENDETVTDESYFGTNSLGPITNLDNDTGHNSSTGALYQPSGHILNIKNRIHRYLGKVTAPGNMVDLVGMPGDTTVGGASFQGRDNTGNMLLIQLADYDSTYFNAGYNSSATRVSAESYLDGAQGHGEVGVLIPGFWYKGINYNTPLNTAISRKYTCYSSYEERPSKSDETVVYSIADLRLLPTDDDNETGIYKENRAVNYSNVANSITDRISSSTTTYDIFRVKVDGYKKMRYPVSIGDSFCCVFTDANGKILTSSLGSVVNYGEIYAGNASYLYNGMPVIVTIPDGAKYFYLSLKKYAIGSTSITSDPCDIVLHKGTNFANGDSMTWDNAKEWIADMEPEWVYSDPVFIHATECAEGSAVNGTIYTPFNGKLLGARGNGTEYAITVEGVWNQYQFRKLAAKRGQQLIDYEASKLIANLFVAIYGRRNSQNVLGGGTHTNNRYLGVTRAYGMRDTCIPANTTVTEVYQNAAIYNEETDSYSYPASPSFLGIEDVQGNLYEWMDRAYYANETPADCGKIRITMPDLSTRRVFSVTPSNNYPRALVHGRYCDIANAGTSGGSTTTYYPDYQSTNADRRTTWKTVRAIGRSGGSAHAYGGVFFLDANASVGSTNSYIGSRLLFRGNFIKTDNITEFENATDFRG